MAEKIVLIDGHSILNRAYFGLPDLTNAAGLHTNAVYGFLNILFKILDEEKPQYLAVAFDVSAPTFRHEIYKEYKGTRKPMAPELKQQVPVMKELLRAMEIPVLEKAGLEADDILGTVAKRCEKDGLEVSLVSGDRDLLQIATDHILIRIPKTKSGKTEIENYHAADVKERYQVTPLQFIELKALMGDTADNIPGVPKVGEKTATELMVTYGSIENLYAHVEEVSKKSVRESLIANRELADLSKVLATINTEAEVPFVLEDAKLGRLYTQQAYVMCRELEFKNILGRFGESERAGTAALEYSSVRISDRQEAEKLFREVLNKGEAAIRILSAKNPKIFSASETGQQMSLFAPEPGQQMSLFTSEPGQQREITAPEPAGQAAASAGQTDSGKDLTEKGRHSGEAILLAVTSSGDSVYTLSSDDLTAGYLRSALKMLSDGNVHMISADSKNLYPYIAWEERTAEEASGRLDDAVIAAYLLNPLKNDYDIEAIASEHLGLMTESYEQKFGKRKWQDILLGKDEEAKEKLSEHLACEAYVLSKSHPVLKKKLEQAGMYGLYRTVEMPLSYVLAQMETIGMAVDARALSQYGEELQGTIDELDGNITAAAGKKFNINSPKQLGEILFEEMKLSGGKKTKTGYSTSADILEKLAPEHRIVADVLEYRTYTKLKSTYADGLVEYIEEDGRIHTHFNQTVTATGRISSAEPNLQNIPMRTELGRKIRKVFIPAKGCKFADADYSQIELRILASMSGDAQLIEAYRSHDDIHRLTASKVFHVPFEEVTEQQRRSAKAVNFGIVYGISSFGLSQDLDITPKEAKQYIDEYFETYPGIRQFLDNAKKDAKEKGYSVTLFGRRRPIPELSSSNFMQRSFGERVAMNAPIQGTAADIMKIAMIKVYDRLLAEGLKARIVLQVHDELLIELPEGEEEAVLRILEEEMKGAADLPVALEAEGSIGSNWYEAK